MFDISITKVVTATTIMNDKNAGNAKKHRKYAAIALKWEGETQYLSNGKVIYSNLTHPVFLPKGSCYTWKCTERGRFTIIEFDTDYTGSDVVGFTISQPSKLKSALLRIQSERANDQGLWQLKAKREIYDILISLLQTERDYLPRYKSDIVKPALEYINEHFNENLTNEQLAALCSVSTVYFRKLFTKVYGSSPINYLTDVRIAKSKEMLMSDYGRLSDIANSVGYTNEYHFSKIFKQRVGMSPGNYAKKFNK